ncbi:MAG: peptidase M48 [Bacteroidetes bacterium GWA2_30_7]|nr:MAG: peptidase M48 [Bacteroidetes bacterium GWA2_30_7]
MVNLIFWLIIAILLFDFLLDRLIDYLNSTKWSKTLPTELKNIYDEEKYQKSQEYDKVNSNFGIITSSFSFLLIMLMLFLGGFAYFDNLARSYVENPILVALVFFGIIMFLSDILNTPFTIYNIFVIEERFGFNKTTVKTFILDKLKGGILGILIGGGLMSLIIWFYNISGQYFWLYAWAMISVFMLFMTMFYSNIIVPLFNKQTPLQEGELKDEIVKFAEKTGFKLKNIFVIDGSKRSTKANAYFTGLGAKKRIVLYDTLINDLTKEEIVAVLAHEIGHYKKKHTLISLIISFIQTGMTLYIMSLFLTIPEFSFALGVENPSFHIGIIAFGVLFSPISMILGIFMNVISRKNEYQADKYAKDNYNAEHLISGLIKLSVKNLSNLTPHSLDVFLNYSHPTLLQRIKGLRGN